MLGAVHYLNIILQFECSMRHAQVVACEDGRIYNVGIEHLLGAYTGRIRF